MERAQLAAKEREEAVCAGLLSFRVRKKWGREGVFVSLFLVFPLCFFQRRVVVSFVIPKLYTSD